MDVLLACSFFNNKIYSSTQFWSAWMYAWLLLTPALFAKRKCADSSEMLYFEIIQLFVPINCYQNISAVILSIHWITVSFTLKSGSFCPTLRAKGMIVMSYKSQLSPIIKIGMVCMLCHMCSQEVTLSFDIFIYFIYYSHTCSYKNDNLGTTAHGAYVVPLAHPFTLSL